MSLYTIETKFNLYSCNLLQFPPFLRFFSFTHWNEYALNDLLQRFCFASVGISRWLLPPVPLNICFIKKTMSERESVWGIIPTKAFLHSQGIYINKHQIENRNTIYTLQPNTANIGYTRRRKTKQKHNTICDGHHYTQSNTNNVNKRWVLLQTTGSKD